MLVFKNHFISRNAQYLDTLVFSYLHTHSHAHTVHHQLHHTPLAPTLPLTAAVCLHFQQEPTPQQRIPEQKGDRKGTTVCQLQPWTQIPGPKSEFGTDSGSQGNEGPDLTGGHLCSKSFLSWSA